MKQFLLLVALLMGCLPIYADDTDFFAQANKAFAAGQYKKAKGLYICAYAEQDIDTKEQRDKCEKCMELLYEVKGIPSCRISKKK